MHLMDISLINFVMGKDYISLLGKKELFLQVNCINS